jgi:hypothetical protein
LVGREVLRAGKRAGVGGRLQMPLRLPPGAAVDHERRHSDEREEADGDEHDCLSGVTAEPL